MGRKCSIFNCNSGYYEKIPIYRLPAQPVQRQLWLSAVPGSKQQTWTTNSGICQLHWPDNYSTVKVFGKERPLNPPSVWPGVAASFIPAPPAVAPPPRSTSKAIAETRNFSPDELNAFEDKDKATFSEITDQLLSGERKLPRPVIAYKSGYDTLIIQSSDNLHEGIPCFIIKLQRNLRFETFNFGIKCNIKFLAKNRITSMNRWSIIENSVSSLYSMEIEHKKQVLLDTVSAMSPQAVGERIFSATDCIRAFNYLATGRALYSQLCEDFMLPSISTLTNMTSKVSKLDEKAFINKVIGDKCVDNSFIILHDEIYIKKMLLYHGGIIFGKSDTHSADMKLSDLDEIAVSPKPAERQKVTTVLKVFSDKTVAALQCSSQLGNVNDTVIFIQLVLEWWGIVNVRMPGLGTRLNDQLRAEITEPDDPRLQTLLKFGEMALKMAGKQGKRSGQLSKDTAFGINHTCNGLVELTKDLLATSHKYVLLGMFSTDPVEKAFSKFRQGSGGTYFINAQQRIEESTSSRGVDNVIYYK